MEWGVQQRAIALPPLKIESKERARVRLKFNEVGQSPRVGWVGCPTTTKTTTTTTTTTTTNTTKATTTTAGL